MDAVPLPAPAPAYVPAGISPLVQALVDREAALRLKKDAEVEKANPDVSKIARYDAELADLVSRQDRLHSQDQAHKIESLRIASARDVRVAEETRLTRVADLGIANANVAAGVPRGEEVDEHRTFQHRDLNRNYGMLQFFPHSSAFIHMF
jgi:hypothetical protein